MPLPEVSNDVTELAVQSLADKVMDRLDLMLTSNTMTDAHSTTALLHISITTHTFILSVIIRFHATRPHIRRANSPSFIKTPSDPHRSEVRYILQAKRHM